MIRIPSIWQLIQDQTVPEGWRSIHLEHQVLKTAQNAQELVTINKGLLQAQAQQASIAASSSSRLVSAVSLTQEQLHGIRDEVTAVAHILDQYAAASLAQQAVLDQSIRSGFTAIHDDLRFVSALIAKVAENQDRERAVLEQVSATLAKPYETKYKELLRTADRLFKHALRKADQNQANNLEDAFKLFSQVIANPIGEYDYYTWFELGWLNWRFRNDLEAARDAFGRAERYSDADGNTAFRVDSLRHLAHVQFLQREPAVAARTIEEAIIADSDNAALLYESALYTALAVNAESSLARLHRTFEIDPVLFDRLLGDDEFQKASGYGELVTGEYNRQRDLARGNVARLHVLVKTISQYRDCPSASAYLNEAWRRVDTSGYLRLRQYEVGARELFSQLAIETEQQLAEKIAESAQRIAARSENERAIRANAAAKIDNLQKMRMKDIEWATQEPQAWRPLIYYVIHDVIKYVTEMFRDEGFVAIFPLIIQGYLASYPLVILLVFLGWVMNSVIEWVSDGALRPDSGLPLLIAALALEAVLAIEFRIRRTRKDAQIAVQIAAIEARAAQKIDSVNDGLSLGLAQLAAEDQEWKQQHENNTRWLHGLQNLRHLVDPKN